MEQFEASIVEWARSRGDIRAVLVVGSRTRSDPPPDAYGDLDLMVYTTDWSDYVQDKGWLGRFGPVWVTIQDDIGEGRPELLVLYGGGYKLDFAFDRASKLDAIARMDTLPEVLDRGYRVLLDKDGITARFPARPTQPPPIDPPTPAAFAETVSAFWYGAVHVAKQIKRNNLWAAKYRDWTMKQQLLAMIEWHARARRGWDYDTWYEGKLITRWADPETLDELNHCFGHFDAADSGRALLATMDLFRRIATTTARRLGYPYPAALDDDVTQYIRGLGLTPTQS
jgi:aminoglycoside 6-adenylyltransferase